MNEDQQMLLALLKSKPELMNVVKTTIVDYLEGRFRQTIEEDPTIENPEAILEIVTLGKGFIDDLQEHLESLA